MSFRVDENDRQHYIQQSPPKKNKVHRAILPRMTPPTKTEIWKFEKLWIKYMCAAFVSLLSRFFVNKWKMQSLKMKMKMIQCSENEKLNESGDSTLTYYRWTRKCSFERNNIGLIFLMHQWNLSGMGKLSVFFHHDHSILDFF